MRKWEHYMPRTEQAILLEFFLQQEKLLVEAANLIILLRVFNGIGKSYAIISFRFTEENVASRDTFSFWGP